MADSVTHPGATPQPLYAHSMMMRAESELTQKQGPCTHNEITRHGYGPWNEMQRSACCPQRWMLISEKCVSASTVNRQMHLDFVWRNLTCWCSTGLLHSSCSSLTSMSEDSWGRNTHMLQCMAQVFSRPNAEAGHIGPAWNSFALHKFSLL